MKESTFKVFSILTALYVTWCLSSQAFKSSVAAAKTAQMEITPSVITKTPHDGTLAAQEPTPQSDTNQSSNNASESQTDTGSVTNSNNSTQNYVSDNDSHVINGNNNTITLRGACSELIVNGDNNAVTITDNLERVVFNGNNDDVQTLGSAPTNCEDNGSNNTLVNGSAN